MDLKTLVLMANCTFPQAVQNQFSLHWTNSQFGWIRAHPEQRLPAELRVCSSSSPGAAVPCLRSSWFSAQWCLDHPTCIPALGASPLLGAWTGTGGNSRPCSSTCLKAASRQDCSWREKVGIVRVIMSYDLIKAMQSFLSAVGLIQIQQLSRIRKRRLFLWKLVTSDLKLFLSLCLITSSGFESRDISSRISVWGMLNLVFKLP